jgi:hypothetical protein
MNKKIGKIRLQKLSFLDQKVKFTFTLAFLKDVQATGNAFNPQKRTSSTSKNEIYYLFLIFVGHFGLSGSGSGF